MKKYSNRTKAKDTFARKTAISQIGAGHDLFKLIDYCSLSVLSASNWTQWSDFKTHIVKYDTRNDKLNIIPRNQNWSNLYVNDVNYYSPIDFVYSLASKCMFSFDDKEVDILLYSEETIPKIKKYIYRDNLIKERSVFSGHVYSILYFIENLDSNNKIDNKTYLSECPLDKEFLTKIYSERDDTQRLTEFLKLIGENI